MRLEVATASDSERLKEFFARMILPGALDISVQRHGSFFDQYRLQSDDFETLMLVDKDGAIQGMATLIFIDGVLNGERQTYAFATDLRIAPTRHAVLQWGQHFLPVLEHAANTRGCRYIFSAIERADNQAYNALIRPQQIRRKLPRYYLLRLFHMVAIHGRLPFAKKPLSSIRLTRLTTSTVSELAHYLRSKSADRPFGVVQDEEHLLQRIARYPGLQLSDVRIARDNMGNILGCAAPWSARDVQTFLPIRYNGFAATAHQLLRAANLLRLAKPLPNPGYPLRLRFLTMLNADSPEAFHRLSDDALETTTENELLVYSHFRGNLITLPPKSYIVSAVPYALYTILPPETTLPDFLQPDIWRPTPEFEAATL